MSYAVNKPSKPFQTMLCRTQQMAWISGRKGGDIWELIDGGLTG
jgi:hypothetical protein